MAGREEMASPGTQEATEEMGPRAAGTEARVVSALQGARGATAASATPRGEMGGPEGMVWLEGMAVVVATAGPPRPTATRAPVDGEATAASLRMPAGRPLSRARQKPLMLETADAVEPGGMPSKEAPGKQGPVVPEAVVETLTTPTLEKADAEARAEIQVSAGPEAEKEVTAAKVGIALRHRAATNRAMVVPEGAAVAAKEMGEKEVPGESVDSLPEKKATTEAMASTATRPSGSAST